MQIEFLGSGGAITIPRPGCSCHVCSEARERGVPYSRTGPSLFVHGPNVLIDTPEESKYQLNRSRITEIKACFYSHWHPDHVMGRRVWQMNLDAVGWPPQNRQTDIYLPQQVAQDFRTRLGSWEHFQFMQKSGFVRVNELTDGDAVMLNQTRIYPFRLAEDYVYAFLFEDGGQRVLIAPDELFGWQPPPAVQGVDLAIIPMGLTEFHALNGERQIPADHPVLKREATFQQTLEIVRSLNAARVVMTHIEEPSRLNYDDFQQLQQQLRDKGLNITFAFDTMLVDV